MWVCPYGYIDFSVGNGLSEQKAAIIATLTS